jgi:hypothetical protein
VHFEHGNETVVTGISHEYSVNHCFGWDLNLAINLIS